MCPDKLLRTLCRPTLLSRTDCSVLIDSRHLGFGATTSGVSYGHDAAPATRPAAPLHTGICKLREEGWCSAQDLTLPECRTSVRTVHHHDTTALPLSYSPMVSTASYHSAGSEAVQRVHSLPSWRLAGKYMPVPYPTADTCPFDTVPHHTCSADTRVMRGRRANAAVTGSFRWLRADERGCRSTAGHAVEL